MEAKPNGEVKKEKREKLGDLPSSSDTDFWGDADIHTNLVPEPLHKNGTHYFVRRTGREAQCTHCDWEVGTKF